MVQLEKDLRLSSTKFSNRELVSNGVVEGTLQHKVCLVLNYNVREKKNDIISRVWDSQPPASSNGKSMIQGALSNNDFCVGVVSMVALSTIHIPN